MLDNRCSTMKNNYHVIKISMKRLFDILIYCLFFINGLIEKYIGNILKLYNTFSPRIAQYYVLS